MLNGKFFERISLSVLCIELFLLEFRIFLFMIASIACYRTSIPVGVSAGWLTLETSSYAIFRESRKGTRFLQAWRGDASETRMADLYAEIAVGT